MPRWRAASGPPVRALTTMKVALAALSISRFVPSRIQPPEGAGRAVVSMAAASEPPWGSVKATAPRPSPLTRPGISVALLLVGAVAGQQPPGQVGPRRRHRGGGPDPGQLLLLQGERPQTLPAATVLDGQCPPEAAGVGHRPPDRLGEDTRRVARADVGSDDGAGQRSERVAVGHHGRRPAPTRPSVKARRLAINHRPPSIT